MIQLDNVTKRYGNKTAVDGLSLDIPAGELFAFLGPNGAGKTTTIKMMCGLLFPTAGRVRLGGYDLVDDGDRARQLLSYVPHEPRVLIVDEPTVGLDPRSVRLLKDLLRREADRGTTIFLSSHSLDVVEELADRIGIIDRGRLIGCGTLTALRTQSASDGSLEDVFLKMTEEATSEPQVSGAPPILPPSPLGGEGLGVRGCSQPPHPQPLSPEAG